MEFKSPKYYKEMRAERRKLQAASSEGSSEDLRSSKPQAEESSKRQAASPKHKASSRKPQASSSMIRDPRNI